MMHCSKWTFSCGRQHWILTVASLRIWTLPFAWWVLRNFGTKKFWKILRDAKTDLNSSCKKKAFDTHQGCHGPFRSQEVTFGLFLCYPDLALGPWQCALVTDSSIAPLRLLLSLSHFFKFSLSPLSMSSLLTSVTLDSSFHFTFLDISNLFGNPLCLIASKLHAPLLGTSALDFVVDLTLCPNCNKTPPTLLVWLQPALLHLGLFQFVLNSLWVHRTQWKSMGQMCHSVAQCIFLCHKNGRHMNKISAKKLISNVNCVKWHTVQNEHSAVDAVELMRF